MSEIGGARHDDPDTSHDAAESIDATALEAKVLGFIIQMGRRGATQDDLTEIMDEWGVQTITPRIHPLLVKGRVFDLGERRVGKSRRRQRVVVARQFLEDWEIEGYGWRPPPTRNELVALIRDLLFDEPSAKGDALAILARV